MRPLDAAAALAVILIWAFNFIAGKVGVAQLPLLLMMALRFALVAVLLAPFLKPHGKPWGLIVALSVVLGGFHFGLMFAGLQGLDAGSAAIAIQLTVPFSSILAWVFYRERMGFWQIIGMIVAFSGVAFLADAPSSAPSVVHLLLVVAAAFAWAAANIVIKRIGPINVFVLNAWVALLACPQLLTASWLLESGQLVALAKADWRGWGAIILHGFGGIYYRLWVMVFLDRQVRRQPSGPVDPSLARAGRIPGRADSRRTVDPSHRCGRPDDSRWRRDDSVLAARSPRGAPAVMIRERPSINCDLRPEEAAVDMLVLHYTGMETVNAALERLCDPAAKVSAHYLVDEDGAVFRLVREEHQAWHAGVSFWRGATDINARSIGIELVNPGHEFGYRPFPKRQMAALADLACDIVRRRRIPARNVVAHSDVAPRRKMDPGELFDWARLAAAGVGLWPEESDLCIMDPDAIGAMLADFGYETEDLFSAVKAFQRHFRPERVNGRIDFQTARRLIGLLDLCKTEHVGNP